MNRTKSMTANLGEWVTNPNKTASRNKEEWFRKRVSVGLKKYFKENPRKNEQWYIKKYGVNYQTEQKGNVWIRKSKIIRQNFFYCERCGKNCKVKNVHHIIPYFINRDNKLDNLIVLCAGCHKIVEHMEHYLHNEICLSWGEIKLVINSSFAENRNINNSYPVLKVIKRILIGEGLE